MNYIIDLLELFHLEHTLKVYHSKAVIHSEEWCSLNFPHDSYFYPGIACATFTTGLYSITKRCRVGC